MEPLGNFSSGLLRLANPHWQRTHLSGRASGDLACALEVALGMSEPRPSGGLRRENEATPLSVRASALYPPKGLPLLESPCGVARQSTRQSPSSLETYESCISRHWRRGTAQRSPSSLPFSLLIQTSREEKPPTEVPSLPRRPHPALHRRYARRHSGREGAAHHGGRQLGSSQPCLLGGHRQGRSPEPPNNRQTPTAVRRPPDPGGTGEIWALFLNTTDASNLPAR